MHRVRRIALVTSLVASPLLACGPSGATSQGSASQALATVAAQAWSGTIKITQAAQNTLTQDDHVMSKSTTAQTASNTVVITVTKGIAVSDISFELHDLTDSVAHYDGYDLIGRVSEDTLASGKNKADASVKVSLYDDGRYEIEYNAGGLTGQYTKVETSKTVCAKVSADCQNTSSSNTETAKPTKQGFVAGGVNGTVNKTQPNVLSGIATEPFDIFSGGTPGKTTITWNLSR